MNQMGLHRPCSHHHPVQTFHGISDDKSISPKALMNINFVSQGLRRTAEPDSQTREQAAPESHRPSTTALTPPLPQATTTMTPPAQDNEAPSILKHVNRSNPST